MYWFHCIRVALVVDAGQRSEKSCDVSQLPESRMNWDISLYRPQTLNLRPQTADLRPQTSLTPGHTVGLTLVLMSSHRPVIDLRPASAQDACPEPKRRPPANAPHRRLYPAQKGNFSICAGHRHQCTPDFHRPTILELGFDVHGRLPLCSYHFLRAKAPFYPCI